MPCWIYIGGYPGVGKLTIAKELQSLISGCNILSNHDLIDRVDLPRAHPSYHDARKQQRRKVLSDISTGDTTKTLTWIFTDSRSNSPIGSERAEDYQIEASCADIPFISVILTCSAGENMRRLEIRDVEGTTKLTDTEILSRLRNEEVMYRFYGERQLQLDVTDTSPQEAAQAILRHLQRFPDTEITPLPSKTRSSSLGTF